MAVSFGLLLLLNLQTDDVPRGRRELGPHLFSPDFDTLQGSGLDCIRCLLRVDGHQVVVAQLVRLFDRKALEATHDGLHR